MFGHSSNKVIGVIYQGPDSSLEIWNDRMNYFLSIIQRKHALRYFLADLNLDLLEYGNQAQYIHFLISYTRVI